MKLFTMLVKYDQTVPHAIEVFKANRDANTDGWGCKDIGLNLEATRQLISLMKATKKPTYMEIMAETPEACRKSAQFAIDAGVDVVIGGHYDEETASLLARADIEYYPFIGRLEGNPRTLYGEIDDIVSEAIETSQKNISGVTLAVYRYEGNQEQLLHSLVQKLDKPLFVAGSVNSEKRIKQLKSLGVAGITIGTSFFDSDFVSSGSFTDNVNKAKQWIEEC